MRREIVLGLPLAAAVLGSAAGGQEPESDAGHGWRWAELELDVWIEPEYGSAHLQGRGTLELVDESSAGPVLEINGALLELTTIESPATSVERGTRKEGDHLVATARLRCARPKRRGDRLPVDFECDSRASSSQFAVTPRAALASWTQAWYPLPAGEEIPLARRLAAAGVTRFHLPPGWQSVSNGEPLDPGEPGGEDGEDRRAEAWRVTQPVARSFACAPFRTYTLDVDGRAVGIHRLQSAAKPPDVELGAIAEILRVLERRYGTYPYPGYRVVEVPLGVGDFLGSSEQGFIMVRPVAFDAPDGNLALFAHELAHGWWGNQVSSEGPGSLLCDEALAQYSAVVAIAAIDGEQGATEFLRFSRPGYVTEQCARGYFQVWRDGQDHALSGGGGNAHLLADAKGHWTYRMLNDLVGDERFFATLREVIRDFQEGPLTLPELRARFERVAPELDLARFFAQWLDRTGAPILEHDWSARGNDVRLTVRQVQAGEPFALALEVALDSASGRRIHAVELAEKEATFTLPGDAPPTGVELDPRHRLLIWTEAYGPRPAE